MCFGWRRSRRYQHRIDPLALFWIAVLLLGERWHWWWHWSSHWTVPPSYRLLIVADPQLTDPYSYRWTGLREAIVEYYCDSYMRRAYHLAKRWSNPDGVLFLGDLCVCIKDSMNDNTHKQYFDLTSLDGGREWFDRRQFDHELARFQSIFPNATYQDTFYVAGNHDIGFGDKVVLSARQRFINVFGSVNYEFTRQNVRVVVLDTISMSAKDGSILEDSLSFLSNTLAGNESVPLVLVTHVPLHRTENQPCLLPSGQHGPSLRDGKGYQYQNMIGKDLSHHILRTLQPAMILSGDDHHHCLYHHKVDGRSIAEYTLATFSWLQGNIYPAFAILSLTDSKPAIATYSLPSMPIIFLIYGICAFITMIVIAAEPYVNQAFDQMKKNSDFDLPHYKLHAKHFSFAQSVSLRWLRLLRVACFGLSIYSILLIFDGLL